MIKIYSKLIMLIMFVFAVKANAQCTGCTTNITGLDAASHIINSGQVFCIASTGTVTGQITISAGGIVCNQGKIISYNLWIAGGILENYGTINTHNLLVSSAGIYTNYSNTTIDSLLVENTSSNYVNHGTQTSQAFGIADHGTVLNTGYISAIIMADSLGTFTNNGVIDVTGAGFSNAYSSNFTNNGNLNITTDFANSYSSTLTNNNYMSIGRDWYNSTNANFTTKCMMSVSRDWYNSANVYGPTTSSCGGFNVVGGTYNSGVLGSASTHIDICDAGNPALGIDGPAGTMANTTTYCNCGNLCYVTGIKDLTKESSSLINAVYPNPTSNTLNIKLNNKENETLTIEVRDMMGKTVSAKTYQASIGENETEINVSTLSQGTYILNITDSRKLQSKSLFTISK